MAPLTVSSMIFLRVTVESADELTNDEGIMMIASFEAKVSRHQKQDRGYTDEQTLRWECEALGLDPATHRPEAGSDQP